ncbi:MAG: GNAT family N-acetyltransferase [Candidatus Bathyarchaeia archaeon]
MTPKDFAFAVELTDIMNWNFTEEDFHFMMELEPEGCFIALDGVERVGIVTAVCYGKLGWIGNLLVKPENRLRGIGSRLLKHAMDYLGKKGAKTIGLYSYVETVPFYEKFGFKCGSRFIRFAIQSLSKQTGYGAPEGMDEADMPDVIELDSACGYYSREKLLRRILADSSDLCYVARKNGKLVGFIMADWYRREIGPWLCLPGYTKEAINLLRAVLNKLVGIEAHIGVLEKRKEILGALKGVHFKEEFRAVRMFYGECLGDESCLLAMESLERG